MKKTLIIFLVCAFIFSVSLVDAAKSSAENNLPAGTVIKGEGLSTLYYIGEDGKRYVFPNSNIFFSWYDNFSKVVEVPLEDLYEYPLGGNARYKPGALLIKIQTDPKVYAVGGNGKLHWIKTEKIAKALYGNNWNKLIDDVPDSFFTNYEISTEVNEESDFDPSEEEEQMPSISHNRGFKAKIAAQTRNRNEKICDRLESALNRLQKRLSLWDVALPNIGDHLLDKCYGLGSDGKIRSNALRSVKKVTLCHEGKTINVGIMAIGAHLKQGGTIGACADSDSTDDTDNDDGNDIDLSIENVSVEASANSATTTITTNKNADITVKYATEEIGTENYEEVTATGDNSPYLAELSGLSASTTYFYLVEATDDNSTATSSGNFDTAEDASANE